jgi:membrane carboxypeptidase/penicillin-binding protein
MMLLSSKDFRAGWSMVLGLLAFTPKFANAFGFWSNGGSFVKTNVNS